MYIPFIYFIDDTVKMSIKYTVIVLFSEMSDVHDCTCTITIWLTQHQINISE